MKGKLFVIFLAALAAFAPSLASAQCQGWSRWTSGYGYRSYRYGWYGYQCATGVKFHLDLVAKSDRKEVKGAVVSIDGNEFGTVNRFDGFWNGILPLPPGQHEVVVESMDGRKFRTIVALSMGTVVPVYVRFAPENGATVAPPASTTPVPQIAPATPTPPQSAAPSEKKSAKKKRVFTPRSRRSSRQILPQLRVSWKQ